MKCSKATRSIMSLIVFLDIVYFFLVPFILISLGLPVIYAIGAGFTLGFFQPSLGAYHEYNHNSKSLNLFESLMYKFTTCTMILGPLDLHHKYFHHRYANSEKDLGSPSLNKNYYKYQWEYAGKSNVKLFKTDWWKMTWSSLGFLSSLLFQWFVFGPIGIAFQLSNVLAFHWTTAAGNYAQHYGLEKLPINEKEKKGYAWDNKGELAKYLAFNIHIHSDHHVNAKKPCDELKNIPGRPINPYPLPVMMFLAMVPYLYYRVMNPRLEEYIKRFK